MEFGRRRNHHSRSCGIRELGTLKRLFDHSKWASVVRQFNFYAFAKCNRAPTRGKTHVYRHPNFRKNCEELLYDIKPKAQCGDSAKALVTKQQRELKKLERELSNSEAKVSQLEEHTKRLEDKNERLEDKNKRLEDKNEKLENKNERSDAEIKRLEGELRNLHMRLLHAYRVVPTVPFVPSSDLQAAGNWYPHGGSTTGNTHNHSQHSTYAAQSLLNYDYTTLQPPYHQGSSYDNFHGTDLPHPQPTNAPVATLSGPSDPSEFRYLGQEDIAAPVAEFQLTGFPVARQPSPNAPEVLHARTSVTVVSQQRPRSQGTWRANLAQIFSSIPSPQQ